MLFRSDVIVFVLKLVYFECFEIFDFKLMKLRFKTRLLLLRAD